MTDPHESLPISSTAPLDATAPEQAGEGYRLAEEIVAAALAIVVETGDESRVTLSEVARRVGIAVPSIYAHFDSPASICQAVVAHCWTLYDQQVLDGVEASDGVAHGISRWAHRYVSFGRDNWGIYRVLLARDNSRPVPGVKGPALDSLARLAGGMALVLGVPEGSDEARDAALGLWIELHGIVVLPPAHPRFPWPADDHLVEQALRRTGVLAGPGASESDTSS